MWLAVPLDRAGTALAAPSGITLVRPSTRDYAGNRERRTFGLVQPKQAPAAVARDARPVRDPRQRGDAAADAGRARDPALDGAGSSAGRPSDALAAASAADVIVAWQGLGYNRRAVNLHRAAQHVAAHGWPDDLTELPGVGPYTAGAVGNFAFGRDVLPVDTNVRRIQERTGARVRRLVHAGALRPRRDDLPRAHPALRRLPARGRVPVARVALRAAAQAVARSRARSASAARSRCARSRRASSRPTAMRSSRSRATGSSCSRTGALHCRRDVMRRSAATARLGDDPRQRGLVRDEPVDAEVDERDHLAHVVDRPRHDAQPDRVRRLDELARDEVVPRADRLRAR